MSNIRKIHVQSNQRPVFFPAQVYNLLIRPASPFLRNESGGLMPRFFQDSCKFNGEIFVKRKFHGLLIHGNISLFGKFGRIGNGSLNILMGKGRVALQYFLFQFSGGQIIQNNRNWNAGPSDTGLAVANIGINHNSFE